ncbi:MAG: HAMP domain-containing protein [Deltaproteobacteria bacterium]|nr:HAMP domain-containing protein [Deltaproteobacteria bacterium]
MPHEKVTSEAASAPPPAEGPLGAAETPAANLHHDETAEEATERALRERPSISIRARLALGFLTFVLLSAGTAVTSWVLLGSVDRKMQLLVLMDRLTIEVQQARRFEKNYLLYGTNLGDALDHARSARELLANRLEGSGPDQAVSLRSLTTLAGHLDRYEELLAALASPPSSTATGAAPRLELVGRLREQGARVTSAVLEMAQKERRVVSNMLALTRWVPLIFLILTLLMTGYVAHFLGRQMLASLGRMVEATQRIAAGDFTLIQPARRYRDEFTDLALGINRMVHELERRLQIIVESHKLRAIGTLTAGIAHELNNPLNNITLTATTLRQFQAKLSDEERGEMLDDLVTQAERSQSIVRNLLDFTRRHEARIEPVDLGELLADVAKFAHSQVNFHGCSIETQVPENLPRIHGDRGLLSQVLLNLCLNALDALQPGGRIQVRVDAVREPGFLAVDVTDNGSGIPEHVLGSIFDPFFTTKPTGEGTGLGLSMSLGIVRRHGGDIRVASKVGVGSTFTVLLPVTTTLAAV